MRRATDSGREIKQPEDILVNRRMGFTVVEMMIVVVIIGLVTVAVMPKVRQGMVQTNVRGARTTVVNALAKARAGSTQTGRRTWLKLSGNKAIVLARPRRAAGAGDADTLGAVQDLSKAYGVTLTSTVDSIQFDPRGLGTGLGGAYAMITVTKGSHYNQIKVDGLGRITQ